MTNSSTWTTCSTRIRRVTVGNNLDALTRLDAGSVGLVYLDPPFNSGRIYESRIGKGAASASAFVDTWNWDDRSEQLLRALPELMPRAAASMVSVLVGQFGRVPLSAYLVSIGARLGQSHRLLTEEGSLYLHVDPAASHYLKVVLDAIFGPANFRNELVWKRTHAHSGSRRFGPIHDTILFYSRSDSYVWHQQHAPYSQDYIDRYFTKHDQRGAYQAITCTGPGDRNGTRAHYAWKEQFPPPGRHWAWVKEEMERLEADDRLVHSRNGVPRLKRYADEGAGVRLQDIWTDVAPLSAHAAERVGYDTQKPTALLERIIAASTNPGDLVLDPYCGTGTTGIAAERLGRSWHVIDSSLLAGGLTLARARAAAPDSPIELAGMPHNVDAAVRQLRKDPLGYSAWATALLATHLHGEPRVEGVAQGRRAWGRPALGLVPVGKLTRQKLDLRPGSFSVGFVVEGPGSASFADQLSEAGAQEVASVPMVALVGPTVARAGAAAVDLRLAP